MQDFNIAEARKVWKLFYLDQIIETNRVKRLLEVSICQFYILLQI